MKPEAAQDRPMEERKDRDDRKPYTKPEVREYGSIYELTAGLTATGNKNDMAGGPIKT
jgi:hypothetical protein